MKNIFRGLLGLTIIGLVLMGYRWGLFEALTFDHLKLRQAELQSWTESHFVKAILVYFFIYVGVTALSIPGAAVMSLAGGAIFGFIWGTILVSFASTCGATLCFLGSRFFFREVISRKFIDTYERVDRGLREEGAFYLFSLRLIPAVPFFVINLVFGLTRMSVGRFYIVSQVGMLPGTFVYVNAGTRLGEIAKLSDVVRPEVWMSFLFLALLPWLGKWALRVFALIRT